MWSAIRDSVVRPIVIVLLDPVSDGGPSFRDASDIPWCQTSSSFKLR